MSQSLIYGSGERSVREKTRSSLAHLYAEELVDIYKDGKMHLNGDIPSPKIALDYISKAVFERLVHICLEKCTWDIIGMYYRDVVFHEMKMKGIRLDEEEWGYIHKW